MIPAGWRQRGIRPQKNFTSIPPLFNIDNIENGRSAAHSMGSSGINDGQLRGQAANPGLRGTMAVKTECVAAYLVTHIYIELSAIFQVKA